MHVCTRVYVQEYVYTHACNTYVCMHVRVSGLYTFTDGEIQATQRLGPGHPVMVTVASIAALHIDAVGRVVALVFSRAALVHI